MGGSYKSNIEKENRKIKKSEPQATHNGFTTLILIYNIIYKKSSNLKL